MVTGRYEGQFVRESKQAKHKAKTYIRAVLVQVDYCTAVKIRYFGVPQTISIVALKKTVLVGLFYR